MLVKELLVQYAQYNGWAHKNLLDLICSLSPEQQHMIIPSSFDSLYKTVYHVWGAETLWLKRLNLEPAQKISGDRFSGSMADLASALEIVDRQWVQWFDDKQDSQLTHQLHYTSLAGQSYTQPCDILLQHIFNHSTYHNGQLVTMLRASGIDRIPSTDFVTWSRIQNT
jgi:uncharacterized damage-inducible protein DinB